ncbi:MAG: cytochrome b [Wenzhouxiangellaceae bacterium]|nr:cytochrome b [Wenzhouxiangellaceae bacterium]
MTTPMRNTRETYGWVARFLHWAVVAGIVLQYVWAWRIDGADSVRVEFLLVNEHKSIGVTVLMLAVARLAWRVTNPVPAHPEPAPDWERRAARATHWLLYAAILIQPVTGWAWSAAAGYGPEFFGLVDLPPLVPDSARLEAVFGAFHRSLAWALPAIVAVHVAAVVRHHLRGRPVLGRMGWS